MKYNYTDGSGNAYKLQNSSLTYNPMKPKMSSSGIYSGGEPFTIELEKQDLISLIDIFERALWSKQDHTDKRTMGSGILVKYLGDQKQQIYLAFRSDSLREIDDFLKRFKSK